MKKAGMSIGKKLVIVLILILLALSGATYSYGVYYFTGHFLPGSTLNGWNCSYMDVEETEDLLSQEVKSYVLTINTKNNGQESITADQASLEYSSNGEVQRLMKNQDRFKWFLAFNQEQNYEIPSSFVFDTEKLYDTVSNLKCMLPENTTEPMDAQIQETKEGFEIVPETEGTALKKEEVQNLIAQAIVLGTTSVDLEAEGCYEYPSVYRDDELLIENCRRMNTLTDVIITYDFADRTETVDKDLIKNWVMEDEEGYYVLDRQTIAAYVSGLAEKYDTFGNSRTFTTYAGVSKIIDGGNYGWIIDQEAETQALMDAIESGVTQVREPVYKQEAWERDSNDIGYTYIEIDLSNQRLVLYMNGTPVVDTYTITGNPNVPGYETPTGCYTIADMQSPATVTGEEYSSVNYWIAFCGNIGINDAAWRNSFGNNIYLFEGSCGCVNISYDAAQQLYQNVSVGMPVVVYE